MEVVDPVAAPPIAEPQPIHCPLCEYDLQGLTEPRCPECGYAFTWDEIRDPTRRLHPYLFEHHPERNVSSFVQTLLGSARPRRFWRTLAPQQPANARRLVLYWLIVLALGLPALFTGWAVIGVQLQASSRSARVQYEKRYLAPGAEADRAKFEKDVGLPLARFLDRAVPLFPTAQFFRAVLYLTFPRTALTALLMAALWPWMTMLGMRLMLWTTVRRARVRMIHFARCGVHCGDVAAWYLVALAAGMVVLAAEALAGGNSALFATRGTLGERVYLLCLVAFPVTLLVACYRLIVAVRTYLRLPHAAAVVILTQVVIMIVLLIIAALVMDAIR